MTDDKMPAERKKAAERKPDYENEILNLFHTETDLRVLRKKIREYHASDIADAFEQMPIEEWDRFSRILSTEDISEVLEYMDLDLKAEYLGKINIRKAVAIINGMESDKAAELLRKISPIKREVILELIEPEIRSSIDTIYLYAEDEIGSKMTTNFISIVRGLSLRQALDEVVRQAPDNDNLQIIYVKDENGMYYGALLLKDLFVSRQGTPLEDLISTSYPFVYANEQVDHVIEDLKDYNADSIPVLNNDNNIIGIITAQDLLEVVDEEMSEDYARFAGLSAQEDLEESVMTSTKKRFPWLFLLLFLGLLVSGVVSMFEGVVQQLTIVMAFQSLILDMAGNVGTQSLGVSIRVLTDDDLTNLEKLKLVFKEVRVGFANGMVIGLLSLVFLGFDMHWSKGFGWGSAFAISTCICLALLVSMVISSFTGTFIPIFFKDIGVDPAVASGPLITTVNDMIGVVSYYGLAWVFLIQILHL